MISIPTHTLKSSSPDPLLSRSIAEGTIFGVYSNGSSSMVCISTFSTSENGFLSLYAQYLNTKTRLEQNLFLLKRYDIEHGIVMNLVPKTLTRKKWYDTLREHKGQTITSDAWGIWQKPPALWSKLPLHTQEEVLKGFR